eukprot:166077-Pyramimonas_sp.AAC.1
MARTSERARNLQKPAETSECQCSLLESSGDLVASGGQEQPELWRRTLIMYFVVGFSYWIFSVGRSKKGLVFSTSGFCIARLKGSRGVRGHSRRRHGRTLPQRSTGPVGRPRASRPIWWGLARLKERPNHSQGSPHV